MRRYWDFSRGNVAEKSRFSDTVPSDNAITSPICECQTRTVARYRGRVRLQRRRAATYRIRSEPKLTSMQGRWTSLLFALLAAASRGLIFVRGWVSRTIKPPSCMYLHEHFFVVLLCPGEQGEVVLDWRGLPASYAGQAIWIPRINPV